MQFCCRPFLTFDIGRSPCIFYAGIALIPSSAMRVQALGQIFTSTLSLLRSQLQPEHCNKRFSETVYLRQLGISIAAIFPTRASSSYFFMLAPSLDGPIRSGRGRIRPCSCRVYETTFLECAVLRRHRQLACLLRSACTKASSQMEVLTGSQEED